MLKFRVTIGCLRSKQSFDRAGVPYRTAISRYGTRVCPHVHYTGYRRAGAATLNRPRAVAQDRTGLDHHPRRWIMDVEACVRGTGKWNGAKGTRGWLSTQYFIYILHVQDPLKLSLSPNKE